MSVNKVILVGRLGKDVELRYTSNGNAVANFSLATSDSWTDKEGKKQEKTEWHNIVAWGKTGENCAQYTSKGSQVYLEGSIHTRSYDDKSGNKRYVTEVVAQRVQFLGSKKQDEGAGQESGGSQAPDDDDRIPY